MALNPTVTTTAPTTLLEAVNTVLRAARITGISTLTNIEANEDAASAKVALDTASRAVQVEKWEFNREPAYSVPRASNGNFILPANTLSVATARTVPGATRLVQRGNRLYDPKARTYVFAEGTVAYVDITLLLEFASVPEAGRTLITAMAAKDWALPRLPTGATFRYTDDYIAHARMILEREDADMIDGDHATRSPHFAKHRQR